MRYEIVELDLSGKAASIYSIIPEGQKVSLFRQFLIEWKDLYPDEVDNIVTRVKLMGENIGARETFFRHNEGRPGDGVCAFFDIPRAKLRLYCIRYGTTAIILGGGAPKNVRAWQDDPKLTKEAKKMIAYAQDINNRLKPNGDLKWSDNGVELIGNLNNNDDENE